MTKRPEPPAGTTPMYIVADSHGVGKNAYPRLTAVYATRRTEKYIFYRQYGAEHRRRVETKDFVTTKHGAAVDELKNRLQKMRDAAAAQLEKLDAWLTRKELYPYVFRLDQTEAIHSGDIILDEEPNAE